MASPTTSYLITGASSGIGLELVRQLVATSGNHVFATVRKRGSSATGTDEIGKLIPVEGSVLTILENIDVTNDNVSEILIPQLNGTVIDVVVHNAGSLNGTRDVSGSDLMSEQKLGSITMDRMRSAFEVNTLGPLRIQKALIDANLMKTNESGGEGGKIAVISTGFGSIADNESGGTYAYRTSKAGVNMITKCWSCDLKEKGIAVMAIAPGFVATEFGPGKQTMENMGGMMVETSVKGIITLLDLMTLENTGQFYCVKKDEPPKEMAW